MKMENKKIKLQFSVQCNGMFKLNYRFWQAVERNGRCALRLGNCFNYVATNPEAANLAFKAMNELETSR